jgi:hypothetical protein
MSVKLIIDGARLEELLHSRTGAVGRYLDTRATIVQMAAKEDCPKRTGNLSERINRRWFDAGGELAISVIAQTPYAMWVHEGTGIYGPLKRPIVPVHAKALSWIGADGVRVFAKSVKGMRGRPFLAKNLKLAVAV